MSTSAPFRPRLDALLSAALLIAGSLTFLAAGSLHPRVGPSIGAGGTDAYFLAFAALIVEMPHWEAIHTGLLAGPLLWALGAASIPNLLPTRAAALGEIGRAALLLGAIVWAVAFVLDGYIAPLFARTITTGSDPLQVQGALAAFHANQRTMARLGLVSVVLIGTATTALSLGLLLISRGAVWRGVVGSIGLVIGMWPLIAAARGEFAPGPFTSPWWTLTALAVGAWFAALATALPFREAGLSPHQAGVPSTRSIQG